MARFPDIRSAEIRLAGDPTPLTTEEIRELLVWARNLSTGAAQRLSVETDLQATDAIRRFDESSSELSKRILWLTKWLVGLTVVLVLLTLVLAYYTYVVAKPVNNTPTKNYEPAYPNAPIPF